MSLVGKLKSCVNSIPDIVIKDGETVVIGRNAFCHIKNLKCPRRLYQVKLTKDTNGPLLYSTNLITNFVKLIRPNEHLAGPGFDYQVLIQSNLSVQSDYEKEKGKENFDKTQSNQEKEQLESAIEWEVLGAAEVYIGLFKGGGQASSKIAAFDFDGTLVKVKSNKRFPKDANDWKLFEPAIPSVIKKWVKEEADSHRFVIITNQLGISKGNTSLESVKKRIESALLTINIPCIIMIAAQDNIYRKPRPGLLDLFQSQYNQGIKVDFEQSFYVGDAAGRKTALNNDHSCSDLLFAINNSLKFLTPEQFLASQRAKKREELSTTFHHLPKFNPSALLSDSKSIASEMDAKGSSVKSFKTISELTEKLESYNCSLCLIFVGLPGSGKSSFFSNYLSPLGYTMVSRDELGTMQNCEKKVLSLIAESKKEGKSIKLVIDNLNLEKSARSRWISLASSNQLKRVCFNFHIDPDHAKHNNIYRRLLSPKCSGQGVPDWLIGRSLKSLVPGSHEEGFDCIFRINFKPYFVNRSQKEQQLYFMYLAER